MDKNSSDLESAAKIVGGILGAGVVLTLAFQTVYSGNIVLLVLVFFAIPLLLIGMFVEVRRWIGPDEIPSYEKTNARSAEGGRENSDEPRDRDQRKSNNSSGEKHGENQSNSGNDRQSYERDRQKQHSQAATGKQDLWWEVLGVARGSPMSVVEAVFKAHAKLAHPDSGSGSTQRMQDLNNAIAAARDEKVGIGLGTKK